MKHTIVRNAFLMGITLLGMASCMDKDYSEHRTYLDAPASVTVPGDLEDGTRVNTEIGILSTHSWSAALIGDPVPTWLTLEDTSGVNLSGAGMTLPLKLSFDDNSVDVLAERSAQILVTIDGDSRTIDVTQEALVPRFSVDEPHSHENLAAVTELGSQEVRIFVRTNNAWKAEILDLGWDHPADKYKDSTIVCVLDKYEGFKSGVLKVILEDNEVDKVKHGAIKISSAWDPSFDNEDSDAGQDTGDDSFDVESQFEPIIINLQQKALK